MYKKVKVFKSEKDLDMWSAIQNQLFLLLICLATDNKVTQCTENIWADMHLNGGHPDKETIYGVLNVFTWEGWFDLLLWILLYNTWSGLWNNLAAGMFGMIEWTLADPNWTKPFCKPGELDIFGVDCPDFMAALGYTTAYGGEGAY